MARPAPAAGPRSGPGPFHSPASAPTTVRTLLPVTPIARPTPLPIPSCDLASAPTRVTPQFKAQVDPCTSPLSQAQPPPYHNPVPARGGGGARPYPAPAHITVQPQRQPLTRDGSTGCALCTNHSPHPVISNANSPSPPHSQPLLNQTTARQSSPKPSPSSRPSPSSAPESAPWPAIIPRPILSSCPAITRDGSTEQASTTRQAHPQP